MFDHDDQVSRKVFSRRIVLAGGLQAAALTALGWRFFELQVLEGSRYAPLADENRINVTVLAPKRGRIFDRQGRELAGNAEVFRATLVPALAGDTEAALAAFRQIVPLNGDDVERLRQGIKKQRRSVPVVLARDLTFEQVAALNVQAPMLPGIRTDVIWRRKYGAGNAVGHVVGHVGSVDRVALGDDPVLRLPEMRVGRSGAEAGLEAVLRGTGGTQRLEVDARGGIVRSLESVAPVAGRDVTLTIDAELQAKVQARLLQERRASCVVIDVTTGAVAAMVSTPGYDPADLADGLSGESWKRLASSEDTPLLNRAVAGQYPPGSTFKMVTALAALETGTADARERIRCNGQYRLADQTYRCWSRSGHGQLTLHEALRASCDVYFFELANRTGIRAIADMARRLGLGQIYDCGLNDQKPGVVPDPDWKRGKWNAGWLDGETILSGIGQGFVLATPLQLAVMTARLATGLSITPRLVAPGTEGAPAVPAFSELGLRPEHLAAVRNGMWGAVNETGGTGAGASRILDQPIIAGKTGTSQVVRASSEQGHDELDWHQRDHALFVGYAPSDAPRFAVAVVAEHAGGGGRVAAPIAGDILRMMMQAQQTGRYGLVLGQPG
jgi:penicillin-binding protein 2